MITITKERLLKIQQWREIYGPGSNVVLPAEEAENLARIALASLEAEPVACPKCNDTGMADSGGVQPWGEPISVPCDCTAQPALAVDADDNFYSWFGREWHDHYQQNKYTTAAKQMLGVMAESAWKAGRRAAMLQAGNSPVIPDGWISCSERMPEEIGRYWCYVEEQNSLGKSHYQWNCSWNGELWGGAMMYGRVTHWMPLPAAPQQEAE
ncbi:DUF551 domain-containing protein [Citrobacter sedlakii]|uniref:DUF551 domain-containing protein n=1 Tax=Citrobacter sedlakii TaxID=67826 RepID=UPI0033398AD3